MIRGESLESMVHTAVSELPAGTHIDDIADCVCGMMDWDTWCKNQPQVMDLIKRFI